MTALRVDTIMIGATNLDRSVSFYHATIGFPIQSRSGGFVLLDAGSVTPCLSTAHAKLADSLPGGHQNRVRRRRRTGGARRLVEPGCCVSQRATQRHR